VVLLTVRFLENDPTEHIAALTVGCTSVIEVLETESFDRFAEALTRFLCADQSPERSVLRTLNTYPRKQELQFRLNPHSGKMPWPIYEVYELEAVLGQVCGISTASDCTHCTEQQGRLIGCFVVPGFFGGSCCNCHHIGKGNTCSLALENN
jgi:Protein of unknown function (DUF3716)